MMKRHAFTLIEVLLAVFIIGLGSIGLFALIGSVAASQSRAAELTRGAAMAEGLTGVLRNKVGPIGEWTDNGGVPVPDAVFGRPLARSAWYPTFLYISNNGDTDQSLSINPRAPSNLVGGRFFIPKAIEAEIYSNRPVLQGVNYAPDSGSGLGQNHLPENVVQFGGMPVGRLPHYRAALGTLEVEIWKADTVTGHEALAFHATDRSLMESVSDSDLSNDEQVVLPEGAMTTTEAHVLFNYAEYTPDIRNRTAGVDAFYLPDLIDFNEWISSIRLRYSYREDRLLSLRERLVYEPDTRRPSGRRAVAGATVMYRLSPTGRSQYLTLTYAIEPNDRTGEYLPPERAVNLQTPLATNGLLRVSDGYRLHYDEDRGEYYLTWEADDDSLRVGDVLIVGGELNETLANQLGERGADNPVRVSRVLDDDSGGDRRAYLNDSPRYRSRSMLLDTDTSVLLSRVHSLRRDVASLDGSSWRLTPIAFDVLDVQ